MECPVCKVTLLMTDKQGVEIDYCPQCRGIWLDRGELEKIVEKSRQITRQLDSESSYTQPKTPVYNNSGYDNSGYNQYQNTHNHPKHFKKKKNPFDDILDIFDF